MTKQVILYYSQHHGNTEKLVTELCKKAPEWTAVSLADTEKEYVDLSQCETIGFASGVYMAKPHQELIKYIEDNEKELQGKRVFVMLTSGSNQKSYGSQFVSYLEERGFTVDGCYQCKGWDTYGLWKYIGGISKNHPNKKDVEEGYKFLQQND